MLDTGGGSWFRLSPQSLLIHCNPHSRSSKTVGVNWGSVWLFGSEAREGVLSLFPLFLAIYAGNSLKSPQALGTGACSMQFVIIFFYIVTVLKCLHIFSPSPKSLILCLAFHKIVSLNGPISWHFQFAGHQNTSPCSQLCTKNAED